MPRAAAIQCPPFSDAADVRARLADAAGADLAVLPGRHGVDAAGYLDSCVALAAELHLWLVSGSYLIDNALEAAVISPQGIVGRQRQTHRGAWERARGLARGDSLDVFQTPIGAIGLILGEDIRYPEVGRILALQGAETLVHLAADDAPFHEEAWLNQLWREAQANQTFGIQACLIGGEYHGRSALLAPVEMTDDDSGILAQADIDVPACITADFDHDARRAVLADYDITRYFNVDLYRRELLPAYGEAS